MAMHTLTADTLISTLMPSGGGSLASGDTIQLAGHSLIVDADAVDYPVSIANSGADANLELRDLGRIKLNATLPATVHPWIDPQNPLPVSAEPGIDGDPYRTNLTANARAEIQLNGNFGLGGGVASLPTATRSGAFYGIVTGGSGNTIAFDRDIPLHAGDMMQFYSVASNMVRLTVSSYNSATHSVTFTSSPPRITAGDVWVLVAGGVCIRRLGTSDSNAFLSAPLSAGSLVLFGSYSNSGNLLPATTSSICCARCVWSPSTTISGSSYPFLGQTAQADIGQLCAGRLNYSTYLGEPAHNLSQINMREFCIYNYSGGHDEFVGEQHFGSGIIVSSAEYFVGGKSRFVFDGATMQLLPSLYDAFCQVELKDCLVGGLAVDEATYMSGGTITEGVLFVPATSSDVTWRYTDRTVAPGATLRLNCAWQRVGGSATRASVAITDTAPWWPTLWPLGATALASAEFTGDGSQLLTWRNTGSEAATVRVWECVTGTTAGGYLKVEEVKGGQL